MNPDRTTTKTMTTNEIITTYGEQGKLISQNGNVCLVQIGCELRHIHASKVFRNGKSLA
jgi:hypothetical protein